MTAKKPALLRVTSSGYVFCSHMVGAACSDCLKEDRQAVAKRVLEAAVMAIRKACPPAHTYASENADIYIAQDHLARRALSAVTALEAQLPKILEDGREKGT